MWKMWRRFFGEDPREPEFPLPIPEDLDRLRAIEAKFNPHYERVERLQRDVSEARKTTEEE